jgi:acyl carrier protein
VSFVARGEEDDGVKRNDVRKTAEKIVRQIYRVDEAESLPAEFPLLGHEGIFDSVAALRLVTALEKEFGIVVDDEEIRSENFRSLDALSDYLARKLS